MDPVLDTRRRLLRSGAALFYEKGYEAVGVRELCEHADARKGSFYHWWPSKKDLALAVLDRAWAATRRDVLEPALAADRPVLDRFQDYGERLAAHQRQLVEGGGGVLGCRFGNLAVELGGRDPEIRAKVAEVFDAMAAAFADAIREGVARGELPEVDAEARARDVLALMEGLEVLAKVANDPEVLTRLGAGARALLAT